jgi:hypothetical protein
LITITVRALSTITAAIPQPRFFTEPNCVILCIF